MKFVENHRFLIFTILQMGLLLGMSFARVDPVAPVGMVPSDRLFSILYLVVFGVILFITVRWDEKSTQAN